MTDRVHHIDPIPVREERKRLEGHQDLIRKGVQGAGALEWFSEYAADGSALKVSVGVVAGSTPGVKDALQYLEKVAADQAFADEMLRAAIALAEADFRRAKIARDPPKEDRRR